VALLEDREQNDADTGDAGIDISAIDLSKLSLLTVAEVAGYLRVSKMTVYRMVKSGDLWAKQIGRSFRIPTQSVRAYLNDANIEPDDFTS
jgi:excisionase family DNA binding protein